MANRDLHAAVVLKSACRLLSHFQNNVWPHFPLAKESSSVVNGQEISNIVIVLLLPDLI